MKTALRAAAAAAALGWMLPAANAATTSNNFNVSVTLTSQCAATNSGTTTVSFGTYTAFQAAAATSTSVNLTFQCTRGFSPVSAAFDTVNGTAAGVGVVQGLQYTLTAAAPTTTAGTAATTATIGTGDIKTYAVSGTMPAGQAGQCAASSCGPTSITRTLIVTF
ncbi:MAG TPA: spore coat protein U domain-containing protein [Usitatibacter sp.]|nr:spore coat protein U domain-containing protein [Usitatibacter sp.]